MTKCESQIIVYIYSSLCYILTLRLSVEKVLTIKDKEGGKRFLARGKCYHEVATPQPFELLLLQISWLQSFKWPVIPPHWSPLDSQPVYSGFLPEWKISSASVKIPPTNLISKSNMLL